MYNQGCQLTNMGKGVIKMGLLFCAQILNRGNKRRGIFWTLAMTWKSVWFFSMSYTPLDELF